MSEKCQHEHYIPNTIEGDKTCIQCTAAQLRTQLADKDGELDSECRVSQMLLAGQGKLQKQLAELKAKDLEQYNEWTTRVEKAEAELDTLQKSRNRLIDSYKKLEAELAVAEKDYRVLEGHSNQVAKNQKKFSELLADEKTANTRLKDVVIYPNRTPCKHAGCLAHRSHACEYCKRVEGIDEIVLRDAE